MAEEKPAKKSTQKTPKSNRATGKVSVGLTDVEKEAPSVALDPTNRVVSLCAAGMAVDGDPVAAAEYFEKAWDARYDDFEAAVAAHYVARHRPMPADRLAWHARAVLHAEAAHAAGDYRVRALFPSLYLNLGDGLLAAGRFDQARAAGMQAAAAVAALPEDGYRTFVAGGIARLLTEAAARL